MASEPLVIYAALLVAITALVLLTGVMQHRQARRVQLERLAERLGAGRPSRRRSAVTIRGRRDGLDVRVVVGREVRCAVRAPAGAAALALDDARAARAWLGAARGALADEARAALELLATCGVRRITCAGGWLTARRAFSEQALREASTLPLLDALARLAPLLARAPMRVRVGGLDVEARAWAEQDRLLCPYCRDDLAAEGLDATRCDRCRTAHHAECLREAGDCTVFGCRERAAPARALTYPAGP